MGVLAKRAGGAGMIAGQVMDLAAEGQALDLKALQLIHATKTAALISASVEFGAVIADANPATRQLLAKFGYDIGLAFQIIDDVLDVTASEKKHGKSISSDVVKGKTTYASLLGIEQAKQVAYAHHNLALEALKQLPCDTTMLAGLASLIVHREE